MTYIQTSLYGLPGKIQYGNALSTEAWALWHTPVYVFDLWMMKERRKARVLQEAADRADSGTEGQDASISAKEERTASAPGRGDTGNVEQLELPDMRA